MKASFTADQFGNHKTDDARYHEKMATVREAMTAMTVGEAIVELVERCWSLESAGW